MPDRGPVDPVLPVPPVAPTAAGRSRRRWACWSHRRGPDVALLGALLLLAARALHRGLDRWPSVADDEGTYVAQAWAIAERGTLSHYTYWYDHPPFGWIQLAFLDVLAGPIDLVLASGPTAVLDARRIMLIPALVSTALVYALARRIGLSRPFTVLATAAFVFSPLSVALLRSVFLDALALPWMLAAFVLALSPKQRLWSFAAAGVCGAAAVLTKETMVILVPALVLAVWRQCDRRTRPFCVTAFVVPFLCLLAAYPLLALLKGELLPGEGHVSLLDAVRFQLGRESTGTPLDPGSRSGEVVSGWLETDAVLLGAGLLALPFAFFARRLQPVAVALALLVVVALRPGYLPLAYVTAALPFAALVAAGVLDEGWRRVRATWGREHPATVVAVLATVVLVLGIGAHWHERRAAAEAFDANAPEVAATRWIERNTDRDRRVLVDDTFFVDLAESGFRPGFGVVWFHKLDTTTNLDPSVRRRLPHGAAHFDLVVSTPVMRTALRESPGRLDEVRRALRESRVVAQFGRGAERVEVRAVSVDPPAADAP